MAGLATRRSFFYADRVVRALPSWLVLGFVLWSSASIPSPLAAQPVETRRPIVAVIETGPLRVEPDRLRRALAARLGREVLRITDLHARDPAGTLMIVYRRMGRWWVRFEADGRSAERHERVLRPGLLAASLGAVALRLIAEVQTADEAPATSAPEPAPAPGAAMASGPAPALGSAMAWGPAPAPGSAMASGPAPVPHALLQRGSLDPYRFAWDEGIVDPFAASEALRGGVGLVTELVDPFALQRGDRCGVLEVVDPWAR